jgi:hypothetical protein
MHTQEGRCPIVQSCTCVQCLTLSSFATYFFLQTIPPDASSSTEGVHGQGQGQGQGQGRHGQVYLRIPVPPYIHD